MIKEDLIGTTWTCHICKKVEIVTEYGIKHKYADHMSNIPLQLLYDSRYTRTQEDKDFARKLLGIL